MANDHQSSVDESQQPIRDSATESIPPTSDSQESEEVRLKRQGKSLPPSEQSEGQCKPNPEQAQIRDEPALSAPLPDSSRVERLSLPATADLDKCSSPAALVEADKKVAETKSGLQPSAQILSTKKFCGSNLSIGGAFGCMLEEGHKGPHLQSGDAGSYGIKIPFSISWIGDSREVYEISKKRDQEKK